MDQLKTILGHLKKQHFWVLAGLVLLLSLTGWYLASTQLAEEYATNKGKIENEFNELRQIVSQTNHPNEKFEAGTNVLTANLTKDVQKAWTLVYADQKAKVLKWPTALGDDFLEWIEAASPTDDIPIDYRDMYLNYVKEEFPRLLQIVDARPFWDHDDEESGGAEGSRRPRMEALAPNRRNRPVAQKKDYTVIWEAKNQRAIDEALDFGEGIPDSTAVRFCQENLWVYHALLNAIAQVNEGATGNHNAKIKEIVALNIGREASMMMLESLASGRIVGSHEGMGAGMGGMPMGMTGGEMPAGAAGGAPGGIGEGMMPDGTERASNMLDDKRYVDEKGIPLPSGTAGPAEFKRMPIQMQLVMDQREIARLLVALADSALPVEIRQLRINAKMSGVLRQPHRQFGYGNEGGSSAQGSRGGPVAMRRDKAFEDSMQYPYDLPVELTGIIYIFNPPDKSLIVAGATSDGDAIPAAADDAPQAPVEPAAAEPSATETEQPAAEAASEAAEQAGNEETGADDKAGEVKEPAESDAADPANKAKAATEPDAEAPPAGFESGEAPGGEPADGTTPPPN
jgi:hypothetical protein